MPVATERPKAAAPPGRSEAPASQGGRLLAAAPFLPASFVLAGWIAWAHFEGGYFARTWYPSAIAGLLLLAVVVLGGPHVLPRSRATRAALLLLAALVGWSYLSIAWAGSPGSAWEAANQLLLLLLVAWVLVLAPWTSRSLAIFAGVWSLGAAAVCAGSLIAVLRADTLGDYFLEGRFIDPLGYANAGPALAMMAFVPALLLASRRQTPAPLRVLFLVVACFLAEFSMLAQSRGSLIAAAICLPLFMALAPDRVRILSALVVIGLATAFALGPILEVYTVGITLNDYALPGTALPSMPATLDDAGEAIGISLVGVLFAGVLLLLAESRVRLRPQGARGLRLGVAALCAVAALTGLAVAAANASTIADAVDERWETFKSGDETPNTKGARITAVYSDQRYDYWRVALNLFRERPLAGVGAGSFEREYNARRRFDKPSRYTHDIWLRVLAEAGLVGAVLFLGLLAAVSAGLISAYRRLDGLGRGVLAACTVVGAFFLIQASFDWLEKFPALAAPALALPLLAIVMADRGFLGPGPGGGRTRVAVGLAGVIATVAALASLGFPYLSVRYTEAASGKDPAAAVRDLERASALNPLAIQPWLNRGTIALRQRRFEKAAAAFEDSLRVEDNWFAHIELALLAAKDGRPRAARRELAEASDLNASDPLVAAVGRALRRGRRIDPVRLDALLRARAVDRFTKLRK